MRLLSVASFVPLIVIGCTSSDDKDNQVRFSDSLFSVAQNISNSMETDEPQRVEVRYILVAFGDTLLGKELRRSKSDAEHIALRFHKLAQQGEEFNDLIQHSDDPFHGPYKMYNDGVAPVIPDEQPKNSKGRIFGKESFKLNIGGVGVALCDESENLKGWYVIKRLK